MARPKFNNLTKQLLKEDRDISYGKMSLQLICSEFIITGKVQRIGFRGLVRDLGEECNLFGQVENIKKTNKVKVVCEGKKEDIEKFYQHLLDLKKRSEARQKRKELLEEEVKELRDKLEDVEIDSQKINEVSADEVDNLLIILDKQKECIRKKKELKALSVPSFRIDDVNKKELLFKGRFTSFLVKGMTEEAERLDFGMNELVELRRDTLDNLNFDEMNVNFDILNVKYGKVSRSLSNGVSIKLTKGVIETFSRVLEEHDKRLITELCQSK